MLTNLLKTPFIILYAFITTILIRLILALQTQDSPWHTLNGKFLSILSPDPAFHGYNAKLLLEGIDKEFSLISSLIAFLVQSGFDINSVMYFAPAFFSSLIVIPIILLLSLYKLPKMESYLFGVFSGIGFGYYSRTYLGYFDTDTLNIFFPLMILYSFIATIKTRNIFYLLIALISSYLFYKWYHQALMIIAPMIGIFILYILILNYKLLLKYKFPIVGTIILICIAVFYKVDNSLFQTNIERYFHKETFLNTVINGNITYNMIKPMDLVSEARSYDIETLANRLLGNSFLVLIALIGYIIAIVKERTFILALPLLALGFASYSLGIRFTMYANQVLIISYLFFLLFITNKLYCKFSYSAIKIVAPIILTIPLAISLYNSTKFWNTKVAMPVFTPQQVQVLETLKTKTKSSDYIVTWWDYGWPIWYYTGMKTLIDNGKHHQDNYVVSRIFMTDSQKEANHAIHLFYETYNNVKVGPSFNRVISKYKDVDKVYKLLQEKDLIKKKKSEKFIFIPFQMIKTLYTIYTFSNLDIKTGKPYPKNIFVENIPSHEDKSAVYMTNGNKIDKINGYFVTKENQFYIRNIYTITQNGFKKTIDTKKGHDKGLHMILYNKKFYIMDDKFFNSLAIQLYFFDKYEPKYFEKLFSTDQVKLYRVK